MTTMETTKRGTWSKRISSIAILLAALSLLALAAAPLGWRTGLLPLRIDFELLMLAAIAAVLGGVTAAIALAVWRRRLAGLRILLLAGASC